MLRLAWRSAKNNVIKMGNRIASSIESPVITLIYHRVCDLASDPQLLSVSPDNFREQLKYLKENFDIVRFDEEWFPRKNIAVSITFDDGYADNFLTALPILEEQKVPATFFVSTGTIGTKYEFWWDELERLLLIGDSYPDCFEIIVDGEMRRWATITFNQRFLLYSWLHPFLKSLNYRERESLLDSLRGWIGVGQIGRETHRPMTVEELQKLSLSPYVTIGAHTVSHCQLSSLSVESQYTEIEKSKLTLQQWLGREISVFSYPFGGRKDYNRHSVQICKELGFYRTASNYSGQAYRWTDTNQIPRQLVRNWSVTELSKKMNEFKVL